MTSLNHLSLFRLSPGQNYNPEPSDPLCKPAKILATTTFTNHTTILNEFEFFFTVYLLDKFYFADVGKN